LCVNATKTFCPDEHQLWSAAAHEHAAANAEDRKASVTVRARSGIMPVSININGVITAAEDAKISVFDHGLLFGDSVYETLRTYHGKPFLFSRHFARLTRSAEGIHLELPWTKEETLNEIRRTLVPGECRIRLVIT